MTECLVDATRLDASPSTPLGGLLARLRATGVEPQPVAPALLDRLAYGDRSEGALAVVRAPATRLDALRLPADPLLVVLEAVEKPGNLGAILRTADAAGADAVVAADPRTDPFNPNVIRASLGTAFTVPLAVAAAAEARAWLAAHGIRVVAARPDAGEVYTAADLRGAVALVVGAEAEGLTAGWTGPGVEPVRIPMLGIADSLNVSVAAAVLLYEARRQRGLPPAAPPEA